MPLRLARCMSFSLRAPRSICALWQPSFQKQYHIHAEVIASDLSQEHAAQALQQEIERRGLGIDLLVNNAGFALNGGFETLAS